MINIVDNDKSIREGYRILLKSAGFDCRCFETAEEFLQNLQTGETDLLLLDIHLNGINGFTILEYLKNKGLHLPVIIITAFDNQESRKLAKSYGVLAYLRKPIDSEALIDIIKYNLDSQKKNKSTYLQTKKEYFMKILLSTFFVLFLDCNFVTCPGCRIKTGSRFTVLL